MLEARAQTRVPLLVMTRRAVVSALKNRRSKGKADVHIVDRGLGLLSAICSLGGSRGGILV